MAIALKQRSGDASAMRGHGPTDEEEWCGGAVLRASPQPMLPRLVHPVSFNTPPSEKHVDGADCTSVKEYRAQAVSLKRKAAANVNFHRKRWV